MSWFPRPAALRDRVAAAQAAAPPGPVVRGITTLPTWAEWQGARALWAMQIPAYKRGVTLISGTVAQLPLYLPNGGKPQTAAFLAQPEAGRVAWVTMQRLIADLVNHGRGYWLIRAVRGGVVTVVKPLPADTTTQDDDGTVRADDGSEYRPSDPAGPPIVGRVIVFDGFRDGALIAGVDVLTTAYAQEAAARNYADAPMPAQVLKNVSNYELSDTEIDDLIARYVQARQESSVAYANAGVDIDVLGWDAQQTALVAQRNESAIQIARLLNLDPMWLGASITGTGMTYQNRVDMRQDLTDLTLSDYIVPTEQRLSMPDVCGATVRMDTSEFMRANLTERSRIAVELVGAGIVTPEQARAFVSDRPTGGPA